jgi:hypothetical protein
MRCVSFFIVGWEWRFASVLLKQKGSLYFISSTYPFQAQSKSLLNFLLHLSNIGYFRLCSNNLILELLVLRTCGYILNNRKSPVLVTLVVVVRFHYV